MTKRLHIDHSNAKYLADKLSALPGVKVEKDSIHINMVFFTIDNLKMSDAEFIDKLYQKGIKANGAYRGELRFVTNNDVTREDIDYTISCIKELL
jgi:threonine aldolase